MLNAVIAFLGLASIALMRLCPDAGLSRTLHRHLVERPASVVVGLDRRQILFLCIAAGLLIAAGDLVLALGSAEIVLGYAADLALYSDVVLAGLMLAATTRVRFAWSVARSRMLGAAAPARVRVGSNAAQRAPRGPRPHRAAANDNEDPSPLAFGLV